MKTANWVEAWTLDRVDTLRTLWSDGHSAAEIARRLGDPATTNSVLGKVHRLKLPMRRSVGHLQQRAPATRSKKHLKRFKHLIAVKKEKNAAVVVSVIVLPPAPSRASGLWEPIGGDPVALLDLTDEHCRWPIGQDRPYRFCGMQHATGSSYCEAHAARSTNRAVAR